MNNNINVICSYIICMKPRCSNKFKMKQKLFDVIVSAITQFMLDIILINFSFAIFLSTLNIYAKSLRYTISQFNDPNVSLTYQFYITTFNNFFFFFFYFLDFLLLHFIHVLYWVPLSLRPNSSLILVFLQLLQNTDIIMFVLSLSIYSKWITSLNKK